MNFDKKNSLIKRTPNIIKKKNDNMLSNFKINNTLLQNNDKTFTKSSHGFIVCNFESDAILEQH